jgi:AcrR family transcriptional regulator
MCNDVLLTAGGGVKGRSNVLAGPAARRPRQERSRATRKRIVEAATRLFVRDGYVTTTVAAIAEEAGVAVQSLYVGFGSKLGVLTAALDVAIVGDDEPVALLERGWVQDLVDMPDARDAVGLLVIQARQIIDRTYALYAIVQAAAATEAGELLADNKRQRYEGVRVKAGYLSKKRGFAAGVTVEKAADLLYVVTSEESYGLFVVDRGWSPDAWQQWCTDTLRAALCR